MTARFVIGVDGGGTKTAAAAADLAGRVLARAEGPGSNPNFVGREAAFDALRKVLDTVRSELHAGVVVNDGDGEEGGGGYATGDSDAQPVHIALCVPGFRNYESEAADVLALSPDRVSYSGDVDSTFYGALGREYGLVALAGTGSFVTGANAAGERASAGGWGPVIGDPGSGQMIAVQALQAVGLQYDERGPATALTPKLLRHYGAATSQELKRLVKLDNVSKLTVLVREAADEGDAVAQAILAAAGGSLAEMAASVATRLGMAGSPCDLALAGGLPRIGERYTRPFAARLAELCPAVRVAEPLLPPLGGALLLALRACGVAWSAEVLAALRHSLHNA
ncbi:BadF/BadG/BcrA/BcrD ATPase family protein [Paenibacillus koleovorans]|uniref:BadF/BadG/BcrA/BcrD ATPase family protein n=1 Tax=Paenibacillus koleovorans TaxID=121608 RepID=UPI000FD6E1AB|nr:BadF/BadG/BcrA/BcrD ATPase family protein [Paenibacillus koleovorans]